MINIESKIQKTETCWNWLGMINEKGYGRIDVSGRKISAHKYIYENTLGKIPDSLELDHLCRNRKCVRPDHLEPVTHQENIRRSLKNRVVKTHCIRGHEFNLENTYLVRDGVRRSWRNCRVCRRQNMSKFKKANPGYYNKVNSMARSLPHLN